MQEYYRPWGNLQWILTQFPNNTKWFFLGTIASEDRTVVTYNTLKTINQNIIDSTFIIVKDKISRHTSLVQKKITDKRNELIDNPQNIIEFDLLYENDSIIINFIDDLTNKYENIILDISCMPKRFFFPFLKRILLAEHIKNLIITNSSPISYESNEPLSETYGAWRTLPLFSDLLGMTDNDKSNIILFAVGHLPMGSPGPIYDIGNSSKIFLYFPFPGHPYSFDPLWKFIHDIEKTIKQRSDMIIECVSAQDAPELYDCLIKASNGGQAPSIIAPYGPKPFSLAMALFACKYAQPVYYTQPSVYHPDYSRGILMNDGKPLITTYVIKASGRSLY